MRTTGSRRYGASSWLIGALVLIALGLAVTWMLNKGDRLGASLRYGKGQQDQVVAPELPRRLHHRLHHGLHHRLPRRLPRRLP